MKQYLVFSETILFGFHVSGISPDYVNLKIYVYVEQYTFSESFTSLNEMNNRLIELCDYFDIDGDDADKIIKEPVINKQDEQEKQA